MSLRIADMPVSPVQAVHVKAAASISRRDVDARRKTRRAVDATCAFVAGLCVGRRSVGHVERQLEPWRDTGIELRGPAVADVEQAFVTADYGSKVGNAAVRVVATVPSTARLFRLDQLVAKRRARTGRRNFSRKMLGDRGPREFFQEDARRSRRTRR
jgi:phosphatidylserine/phosphatidylglycerophosphate/cardiolipin synthase-like enzyme